MVSNFKFMMISKVNKYFFYSCLNSFISLFATLFLVVSIVFFIQIARLTSYVEISFSELFRLYSYLMPQILLFTVPISFFIAVAVSFLRLSKENESIVIFTLGQSPLSVGRFFVLLASGLSLIMLLNSLVLMPYAQHLNLSFIEYKKTRFNLNIRPGEFGQRFGDWLVFANEQNADGLLYKDIVLYNPKMGQEKLITSSNGALINENGTLALKLENGHFYDLNVGKWQIGEFKDMTIRSGTGDSQLGEFSLSNYWKQAINDEKRAKDLSIDTLVALFPLASVLFALSFGIITQRYERSTLYFGSFGVLFAYFALIMILAKKPFIAIPLIFILSLALSIITFKRKILDKY